MHVNGRPYSSIWINADGWSIDVIDQRRLPHSFEILNLQTLDDACHAIRDMVVRGAPLIGATAAYGFYLAMRKDASTVSMDKACQLLLETRPTAVNLRWALDRLQRRLAELKPGERARQAFIEAGQIAQQDIESNQAIGRHGLEIIRKIAASKAPGESINILTHCNAGWLATVDWGTATAPIYMAYNAGIPLHVWVDETRPRNQGASLTAWELGHHSAPMPRGMMDTLCTVSAPGSARRTSARPVSWYATTFRSYSFSISVSPASPNLISSVSRGMFLK